jgi:hypothetical protein
MNENVKKFAYLNGNHIKILAALFMLIDHLGFYFFPNAMFLRDLGRISMPLFAFMIAEGCKYTKNKVKHISLIFMLGVACQIVFFIAENNLTMCMFITFTLSIIIIYALQYAKKCAFDKECNWAEKVLSFVLFAIIVFIVWALNQITEINGTPFRIEYGFWGCMLPVFAALFDFRDLPLPEKYKWLDSHYLKLIPFTIGIICMCFEVTQLVEWYALLALIPLAMYNGERGKYNLKYFFYVFYPAHLAVLQIIAWIVFG